jgi:hypothetical protein
MSGSRRPDLAPGLQPHHVRSSSYPRGAPPLSVVGSVAPSYRLPSLPALSILACPSRLVPRAWVVVNRLGRAFGEGHRSGASLGICHLSRSRPDPAAHTVDGFRWVDLAKRMATIRALARPHAHTSSGGSRAVDTREQVTGQGWDGTALPSKCARMWRRPGLPPRWRADGVHRFTGNAGQFASSPGGIAVASACGAGAPLAPGASVRRE